MSIETMMVEVTPEKAIEFLKSSKGNRTISNNTVDSYAKDMKDGNWIMNGETLVFDEDGCIRDGHHRLHAIIKSGIPQKFVVVHGVPRDNTIYDVGRNRTYRDIAILNGKDDKLYGRAVMACARYHYRIKYGIHKPSYNQIVEFIDRYKAHIKALIEYTDAFGTSNTKVANFISFNYAMLCASKNGVSINTIKRFIEIVNNGVYYTDKKETSSPVILRTQIMQYRMKRLNNKVQDELLIIVENALWDFDNKKDRDRKYRLNKLERKYDFEF